MIVKSPVDIAFLRSKLRITAMNLFKTLTFKRIREVVKQPIPFIVKQGPAMTVNIETMGEDASLTDSESCAVEYRQKTAEAHPFLETALCIGS